MPISAKKRTFPTVLMGFPPFLKNKEASTASMSEPVKREPDDGAEYDPMHGAFEEIKRALDAGDHKAGADALRAAIDLHLSGSQNED